MNQNQVPISHMCVPGTLVASWSLTQEVAGSSPFTVMTNILVTEFRETFRENSIEPKCEVPHCASKTYVPVIYADVTMKVPCEISSFR